MSGFTTARQEVRWLREQLWLSHGCPPHARYGDDGEMQCNAIGCQIDFKRQDLSHIVTKLLTSGPNGLQLDTQQIHLLSLPLIILGRLERNT